MAHCVLLKGQNDASIQPKFLPCFPENIAFQHVTAAGFKGGDEAEGRGKEGRDGGQN